MAERLVSFLLSPGSALSLWSLVAALLIAAGALVMPRRRPLKLRALGRALFPRRVVTGPSASADGAFTLFAVFGSAALLGWAVASHVVIAGAVGSALAATGVPGLALPRWLAVATVTLLLWVAYEFAYWLDHWLSHKLPVLWAFHKVHHAAETLTPLTVFRVHPVDSLVFYNIVALVTGVTGGVAWALLGRDVAPLTVAGTNVLTIAALMTVKQLHHSHAWIAWRGPLARLLHSPAAHQIHHSAAREHHDRNFGDMLALFDWLAGTLTMPERRRQPLRFGVDGYVSPHTVKGALLDPFADALAELRRIHTSLEPRHFDRSFDALTGAGASAATVDATLPKRALS